MNTKSYSIIIVTVLCLYVAFPTSAEMTVKDYARAEQFKWDNILEKKQIKLGEFT